MADDTNANGPTVAMYPPNDDRITEESNKAFDASYDLYQKQNPNPEADKIVQKIESDIANEKKAFDAAHPPYQVNFDLTGGKRTSEIDARRMPQSESSLTADGVFHGATSTPEEAKKNIENAKILDVSPTHYKENAESLEPVAKKTSEPTVVSPVVARHVAGNTEVAAIVKPENDKLNGLDAYIQYGTNIVKGVDVSRKLSYSLTKVVLGHELSEDEARDVRRDLKKEKIIQESQAKFGLNTGEELFGSTLGSGYDMARGAINRPDLLGIYSSSGAALGAAEGFISPLLGGTVIGATYGAISGGFIGVGHSMILDSFNRSTGMTYQELKYGDSFNGDDSQRAEAARRHLALGAGILMSVIETGGNFVGAKLIPGLTKAVAPRYFIKQLEKAALQAEGKLAKSYLTKLGETVAGRLALAGSSEGFEEILQESVQMITEKTTKTWDGTEQSLTKGLSNFVTEANTKDAARLAMSGAGGFMGGTTFHAAAGTTIKGLGAGWKGAKQLVGLGKGALRQDTQLVSNPNPVVNPEQQVTYLKHFLDNISTFINKTEIEKHLPGKTGEIASDMIKDNGIDHVYVDGKHLEGKDAPLTEHNQIEIEQNSPVRMDVSNVIPLVKKDENITGNVRATPEGPTANEIKEAEVVTPFFGTPETRNADEHKADIEKQRNETAKELLSVVQELNSQKPRGKLSAVDSKIEERKAVLLKEKSRLEDKLDGLNPDVRTSTKGLSLTKYQKVDKLVKSVETRYKFEQGDEKTTRGQYISDAIDNAEQNGVLTKEEAKDAHVKLQELGDVHFDKSKDVVAIFNSIVPDSATVKASIEEQLDKIDEEIDDTIDEISEKYGYKVGTALLRNLNADQIVEEYGLETLKTINSIPEITNKLRRLELQSEEVERSGETFKSAIDAKKTNIELNALEILDNDPLSAKFKELNKARLSTETKLTSLTSELQKEANDLKAKIHKGDMKAFETTRMYERLYELEKKIFDLEVKASIDAHAEERKAVVEAVKKDFPLNQNNVQDTKTTIAQAFEEKKRREELINDKNISTVEDFLSKKITINPKSLNRNLINRFIDDVALAHRKVFGGKEGMDIVDAASKYGMTPVELLTVLSTVPNREETSVLTAKEDAAVEQKKALSKDSFNKSATAKEYNRLTVSYLKQLRSLIDTASEALSTFTVPKLSVLISKARETVASMKVKNLNVNQWVQAEKTSNQLANEATDLPTKFKQMLNAAQNTQFAKEVHIAIGKVNSATFFLSTLVTNEAQNTLKAAGATYTGAMNALSQLLTFDPNGKVEFDMDAYDKFVDTMIAQGLGGFEIPDYILESLTIYKSGKDLTVDQMLYISDKMRAVYRAAEKSNKILSEQLADEIGTSDKDIIIGEIVQRAAEHPLYDPKKANSKIDFFSPLHAAATSWNFGISFLNNISSICVSFDQGVFNGFLGKVVFKPLSDAARVRVSHATALSKRWKAGIKLFGRSEFLNLGSVTIHAPEFIGMPGFENGNMRLSELLTLATHIGNEENWSRLDNYGISRENILKVIERHLEKKHLDFIQKYIWGEYAHLGIKLQELHKKTHGVDLDLTVPKAFTLFGTEYAGGHMKLKYTFEANTDAQTEASQHLADLSDPTKDTTVVPYAAYAGVVRSPQTKERTSSRNFVDLDFSTVRRGFDEVHHDLAFRIPLRDVSIILRDRETAKAIKSVVGPYQYETLVNHVARLTNSTSNMGMLYVKHLQKLHKFLEGVRGNAAVTMIAGSWTSVMASLYSPLEYLRAAGAVNGTKHLAMTILNFTNPINWKDINKNIELAREIDSSLSSHKAGISETDASALSHLMPIRGFIPGKAVNWLRRMKEFSIRKYFDIALGTPDFVMKGTFALAHYRQFISGESAGTTLADLAKMTPEEQHQAAVDYAAHANANTYMAARDLDKAFIQVIPILKFGAEFWNESRNSLNTMLQKISNIRIEGYKMVKETKKGNITEARAHLHNATDHAMTLIVTAIVGHMIMRMLQGKNPLQSDEDDDNKEERTFEETMNNLPKFIMNDIMSFETIEHMISDDFINKAPWLNAFTRAAQFNQVGPSVPITTMIESVASTVVNAYTISPEKLEEIKSGVTLQEAYMLMTEKQRKDMWYTMSLATNGLPVNGAYKLNKLLGGEDDEVSPLMSGAISTLDFVKKLLGMFISKFEKPETEDEARARRRKEKANKVKASSTEDKDKVLSEEEATKEAVDDAKKTLDQLEQPTVLTPKNAMPELDRRLQKEFGVDTELLEKIKYAESSGIADNQPYKRDAKGKPTKELLSNAKGLYQIVPDTAGDILKLDEAKAAGLTTLDQLKEPYYQEIAMRALTLDNLRNVSKQIKITKENLALVVYFTHHFGYSYGIAKELMLKDMHILSSGEHGILSPKNIKANPWLMEDTILTTKALKAYLNKRLKDGEEQYKNYIDSLRDS